MVRASGSAWPCRVIRRVILTGEVIPRARPAALTALAPEHHEHETPQCDRRRGPQNADQPRIDSVYLPVAAS